MGRIQNIIRNNNYESKIVGKIIRRINKKVDERNRNIYIGKETYLGEISHVGWKTEKIRN